MVRTAVTVHKPSRTNAPPSSIAITKQAIDAITGDGNGIDITDFFLSTGNQLVIENTTGSAKIVTIIAGPSATCVKAGVGDFDLSIPLTSNKTINQIESARFKQDVGGSLYVDFETGMTGYVYAIGEARGIG